MQQSVKSEESMPEYKTQQQAFDNIEQLSKIAQDLVRRKTEARNQVIEEVAQHIEKLTGFGQDTISSFAIYIRGMKK
jgi:hypothetical protein